MSLTITNFPPQPYDAYSVEEITPSPRESYTADGFRSERIFKCPWENRHEVALRLKGRAVANVDGSLAWYRPHVYPSFTRALVETVDIEPFWSDGQATPVGDVMGYAEAQLRVGYATKPYDADGGGGTTDESEILVTESLEPFVEFLTLSHQKLYWDAGHTDPLVDTESPAKILRGLQWVYKINKIPVVPDATFSLIGCINEHDVVSKSLNRTFAAKTLLYQPPQLERAITAEGLMAWTLTYRFTYRPDTWEKFFRRGSDTPQLIYKADGTQFKPYDYGDFTKLASGT